MSPTGLTHPMPHRGTDFRTGAVITFLALLALAVVLIVLMQAPTLSDTATTTAEEPYAPYVAGPVVPNSTVEPYAPYTAGPVVPEIGTEPYAPYTAGPVVPSE